MGSNKIMKKTNLKLFQSGANHPKWKGGISVGENKKKYQQERRKVLREKKGLPPLAPRISRFPGLSSKERLRQIRLTVLRHYSGFIPKCACCGENEIKFLAIDHINGGGTRHRKTMVNGKGGNMAAWLLKNGLPEGYQILCHNCNMAKGFWGSCPHKTL
ncbi:MAG: hypothetical protein RBG13Loki_0389 [Promethearchaeota archaeon CR_4]|nr:MAG: hypothetical protein RBG13Loki_0389 [Candidatus Lokiarchaeota archaeon CR_4]